MRLRLFGRFEIEGSGSPEIKLSSAKKLLAVLATRPDQAWPRIQLTQMIWPEIDAATARDRFRTALAHARAGVGESVTWSGGKTLLSFVPVDLACDLWDAQTFHRRTQLAIDPANRDQALLELVGVIGPGFLPEFPDFLVSERRRWEERLVASLLALSESAESRADLEQATAYAEQALETAPYDEMVWRTLVRLHALCGRHVEISNRMGQARQELRRTTESDFSASLRKYGQQVRRQGASASTLTLAQGDVVNRAFALMLVDFPEEAANFLGSPAFRSEIFRSPVAALGLLETVLAATTGASPARMTCAVSAMVAHTVLGQYESCVGIGEEVMASDNDHARLRAAATMLSNAHTFFGNLELAKQSNEEALKHAIAHGNEPGIEIARAQQAEIAWEIGGDPAVVETMIAITDRLSAYTENNARINCATISFTIGTVLLYTGDFDRARSYLLKAKHLGDEVGHSAVIALVRPVLGVVEIERGNLLVGIDLLATGLADLAASRSPWQLVQDVDRVAYALALGGRHAVAHELLASSQHLKVKLDLAVPPAHVKFCGHIAQVIVGGSSQPTEGLPENSNELVRAALGHLEEWRASLSQSAQASPILSSVPDRPTGSDTTSVNHA